MTKRAFLLSIVLACAFSQACNGAPASEPTAGNDVSFRSRQTVRSFTSAKPVLTDAALRSAFELPQPGRWQPGGSGERPRGGVELYASAAPSVVVIRTADGHGSGFVVSADGLVITNHHVVETGLRHRGDASYAMVHVGRLSPEGVMQLHGEPVEATLYKVDPVNDLALLKLTSPGASPLPHLRLSASAPRPGLDCAIVGHPSSGMLWTFRPCQVSSVGDFPKDMVNLVVSRLAATGTERAEIETFVKAQPPRRIMLTSAQANPGDSGGPVVDKTGALIGVTFAGPGNTAEDKFTYHVHVDEVRKFLANVPAAPILLPPDPWNFGGRVQLGDINGDGTPDVLVAGSEAPEVLLFDVDNDTPRALLTPQSNLTRLVAEKKWDFEAAMDVRGSGYTSFYDTDNDGRVDLILATDVDTPIAKESLTLDAGGRWRHQAAAAGQRILSGTYLKSPELSRKLESLLRTMK